MRHVLMLSPPPLEIRAFQFKYVYGLLACFLCLKSDRTTTRTKKGKCFNLRSTKNIALLAKEYGFRDWILDKDCEM